MSGSPQFCVRCGHELKQGERFCTGCGSTIAQSAHHAGPEDDLSATGPDLRTSRPLRPGGEPTILAVPAPAAAAPPERSLEEAGARSPPGRGRDSPASGGPSSLEPRRHYSRWPLMLGLVAVLIAGGTAVTLFVLHSSRGAHASAATDKASRRSAGHSSSTSTSSAPSALPPRQQAAQNLAALLTQSVADRRSVAQAASDVSRCGPSLSQDAQTFTSAATSRQNLLNQLASLPDRSALPPQLLQALTSAWQASAQADQDLAQWVQDETSQGCSTDDNSDANYQAATAPDAQATTDKKAFASLWDPIAADYGLSTYQWNQL